MSTNIYSDTKQIVQLIDNPLVQLVDTRQDSFFNGYADDLGVKGHIIGAVQFPIEWLNNINENKLESFIINKGIPKNKEIILYDADPDRSIKFYHILKEKLNFPFVSIFNNLGQLYKEQSDLFFQFPNFQYFVSPHWLKKLMSDENVDQNNNNGYQIFEVNSSLIDTMPDEEFNAYDLYCQKHIPTAVYLNLNYLEDQNTLNISIHDKVLSYLSQIGIDNRKTQILYSRNPSAAARAAFILKWAGIEDVRLLNGSIGTWEKLGFPLEQKANSSNKTNIQVSKDYPNEHMRIEDGRDIYNLQLENKIKLVSVRSWEEHVGIKGGYENLPSIANEMTVGEPYNAIWGFAGSKIKKMEDYYDPDGSYRNPHEIAYLWRTQGITPEDRVAFYCGTGWRACLPYFYSLILGWENTCLYDGSWIDWQKKELPRLDKKQVENKMRPDNLNDYL